MAHVQFMDGLIREYLLHRGFASTVKQFDGDLKSDKERGFRVDKIIDQILGHIYAYDINGLRELWTHFQVHMFSKLESMFMPGVKKLENGVLKLYLVNASVNNKPDKVFEFFTKMTPELQVQLEWKDWFVFPYVKTPEENPLFLLNFTKQWQDTLLVSLHNFFALIFQYMPMPTLLHYEEDVRRIKKLDEKNESLRQRLALLIDRGNTESGAAVLPCIVEPPQHVLDDFYIIAQESGSSGNGGTDSQAKSLKNLIRSMGSSTSPILGKKEQSYASSTQQKKAAVSAGKTFKTAQSQFYD